MSTNTRALVAQMSEAVQTLLDAIHDGNIITDVIAVRDGIASVEAADQWLASPPVNQCGETCERAKLCAVCARGREEQPAASRYAYSIDGGETYHGSEPTPEDALGSAHDDLSAEYEPGTTHVAHVAMLVPGVEILRRQTTALEFAVNAVCERLEEALYDEIGGDEQLIDDLTAEQRLRIGRAMLELIAATGAITGQGLAGDTVHSVTLES